MEDTYKGQVDNPLSLNRYTYVSNNPLRFVDPSGHQNIIVGEGSSGTYYYYDENGVRLIHGSKQIDWDYYDEWYRRDAEGMVNAMRGKNLAQTAIAATAYFRYSEKVGLPPVSSSQYTSSKVLKPNNQIKIKSSISGCNCFSAGTKVQTDEGEKNIEDIVVGDKVLSKNDETGEVAYKEVTATFNHETDEIYNINVGGQKIESTFNHPFYVKDKGWTFVKDLKVEDLLVQSDGNTLKIDSIELLHKNVTVYNMSVDVFHTYFVSDLGIWVHNTNCTSAGTPFSYSYEPVKKGGKSIADQITERGWNDKRIGEAIDNPAGTVNWVDQRKGMNNAPVTVYYHENGGYVARRNDTGEIIQASDLNDPNWSTYWSPSDIKWNK